MNNRNGKQMFLLIGVAILSVEIAMVLILSMAMRDKTPDGSSRKTGGVRMSSSEAGREPEGGKRQSPEGRTVSDPEEEKNNENTKTSDGKPDVFTENDYYEIKPAFYIQAKVLEWAGYPAIRTSDDFFDLIDGFIMENPITPDGSSYIAYLTPDEEDYKEKLYTGRVLGTYNVWADFGADVTEAFRENGMREEGCDYLPLDLFTEGYEPSGKEEDPDPRMADREDEYEESRRKVIDSLQSEAYETVLACLEAYGAGTYAEFAYKVRME
ncbi:MAG: hypothetical protein K6F53_05930 [Lachnospiraceae bacterium]|nr:hypothetical protein [Lachnospiraceae bacterium]